MCLSGRFYDTFGCRSIIRISFWSKSRVNLEDFLYILHLQYSSLNLPIHLLSCQRTELREINKAYLWPRSKGWMRAGKRTFNLQRLKSQICFIYLPEFVSFHSLTNHQNSSCINQKNVI